MKAESPAIDQANIASMAACLMGKIDGIGFLAARDLLADPNRTLLREKWLPVAEAALEHFNFLQRPTVEPKECPTLPTSENASLILTRWWDYTHRIFLPYI